MYVSDQFCPKMSLHYDRKYIRFNRYPQWAVFCGKVTTKEENKEILMSVVFK